MPMPIDSDFQRNWKQANRHRNHWIWQSDSSHYGIHGTRVAVDFDECTGCLKCIAVCPEDVFEPFKVESGQIKADPVKEMACLECLACEMVCPEDAIFIIRAESESDTLSALLD
ncbi:MAG: ferredoxin family protein [Promethearchaeota archaeon]